MKNVQIDVMKNMFLKKIIIFLYLLIIILTITYITLKINLTKNYLWQTFFIGGIMASLFKSFSYFIKKILEKYFIHIIFDIFIVMLIFLSFIFLLFAHPIKEYNDFKEVFLKTILFYSFIRIIFEIIYEKLNFYLKLFLGIFLPALLYLIYVLWTPRFF